MDIKDLIAIAKKKEGFRDRVLDDINILVPAWMKYVAIKPGPVEIAGESLYETFLLWCERTGLPTARPKVFFSHVKSLPHVEVPGKGKLINAIYSINYNLGALTHLSRPTQPKWYGLTKGAHQRPARQYVDCDYVRKLRHEERAFLAKFLDEYYNQRFERNDTDIHEGTTDRREICRNNAPRSRDLYSISACVDKDHYIYDSDRGQTRLPSANYRLYAQGYTGNGLWYESEDSIIDLIDASRDPEVRKLLEDDDE